MNTHFYAFGSVCRGEIDPASDIDLLACLSTPNPEIDPKKFSIYTYERIRELWHEGNPFAWHLYLVPDRKIKKQKKMPKIHLNFKRQQADSYAKTLKNAKSNYL